MKLFGLGYSESTDRKELSLKPDVVYDWVSFRKTHEDENTDDTPEMVLKSDGTPLRISEATSDELNRYCSRAYNTNNEMCPSIPI